MTSVCGRKADNQKPKLTAVRSMFSRSPETSDSIQNFDDPFGALRGQQIFAKILLLKQTAKFGDQLEVVVDLIAGNAEEKDQSSELAVTGAEIDATLQARKGHDDIRDDLRARVGQGCAHEQTGRNFTLAPHHLFGKDRGVPEARLILEALDDLVYNVVLVLRGQVQKDALRTDQIADLFHDFLGSAQFYGGSGSRNHEHGVPLPQNFIIQVHGDNGIGSQRGGPLPHLL